MSNKCITVMCGVENCMHNKDHYCNADGLEVNAQGDGRARTSDGTCCTTFKERR